MGWFNHQLAIAFLESCWIFLVFFWVFSFWWDWFLGLFGVSSSEDCSQWLHPKYPGWRALDSQRCGAELPGLLAMPIETLGHTWNGKKLKDAEIFIHARHPFFVQFSSSVVKLHPDRICKIRTKNYCCCDAIMQMWLYSTGSSNVRKGLKGLCSHTLSMVIWSECILLCLSILLALAQVQHLCFE